MGPHFDAHGIRFGRNLADVDRAELVEGRKYHAQGKEQALTLLRQAVRSLTATAEEKEELAPSRVARAPVPSGSNRRIFVVHGHDEAALQSVARFLEKVELEPIVLKEQPDRGLTIIEKFVEYAGMARFAIVLLTLTISALVSAYPYRPTAPDKT